MIKKVKIETTKKATCEKLSIKIVDSACIYTIDNQMCKASIEILTKK